MLCNYLSHGEMFSEVIYLTKMRLFIAARFSKESEWLPGHPRRASIIEENTASVTTNNDGAVSLDSRLHGNDRRFAEISATIDAKMTDNGGSTSGFPLAGRV